MNTEELVSKDIARQRGRILAENAALRMLLKEACAIAERAISSATHPTSRVRIAEIIKEATAL